MQRSSIVGDVHGCFDELRALLGKLGYSVDEQAGDDGARYRVTPPAGRRLIFLGDLVDRGPRVPDVVRLVIDAVRDGNALCIAGNHEAKLLRKLAGKATKLEHGLHRFVARQPLCAVHECVFGVLALESEPVDPRL